MVFLQCSRFHVIDQHYWFCRILLSLDGKHLWKPVSQFCQISGRMNTWICFDLSYSNVDLVLLSCWNLLKYCRLCLLFLLTELCTSELVSPLIKYVSLWLWRYKNPGKLKESEHFPEPICIIFKQGLTFMAVFYNPTISFQCFWSLLLIYRTNPFCYFFHSVLFFSRSFCNPGNEPAAKIDISFSSYLMSDSVSLKKISLFLLSELFF